jgi:uncharacterized protein (TIGR00255 family)
MSTVEGQIQSMTGFAQVVNRISLGPESTNENATLLLELKSVNSRYLDLTFKVPDELRQFESLLREQISAKVKRGKLECRVSLKRDNASDENTFSGNQLNKEALAALITASQELIASATAAGLAVTQPNALDLLRLPGIWGRPASEEIVGAADSQNGGAQLEWATLNNLANQALDEFTQSRLREGAQTAQAMLRYGDEISALVHGLEAKLPQINAEIQKRFADKVWERLLGAPNQATANQAAKPGNTEKLEALLKTEDSQNRINQELVLMAMRADVSEEISRLTAHIAELRKTLSGSGAVGKKLDFLMQEFNREANTLGSKAPNLEVSKASTELKLAIEQIREQVQNLE